jgi:hypothetical protein
MAKIIYTPDEVAFLASLQDEECGAVNVKRINEISGTTTKLFSVELAQRVSNDNTSGAQINPLAIMNPTTMSSGRPQRNWLSCDAQMCNTVFGVDLAQLETLQIGGGRIPILLKNPNHTTDTGVDFWYKVQLIERFESEFTSTAWEMQPENYENAKKTAGSGSTARDMKGLNPKTGKVEQIFRTTTCQAAIKDAQGNLVNAGWKHHTISEYVDESIAITPTPVLPVIPVAPIAPVVPVAQVAPVAPAVPLTPAGTPSLD